MKLLLSSFLAWALLLRDATSEKTCSLSDLEYQLDPNLKEMTFDIGNGKTETFMAYVTPNVTSFYQGGGKAPPASKAVKPKHDGLAGMFINMSDKPMHLYWLPHEGGEGVLQEIIAPFGTGGTASFPGHIFFMSSEEDPETPLIKFYVKGFPNSRFTYDPYHVEGDLKQTEDNLKTMTNENRKFYDALRKSHLFSEEYLKFTGRSYLANYPRPPPMHYIWPADYFGQTHWVVTKETRFISMPPDDVLKKISTVGTDRVLPDDAPRLLNDYREEGTMNMTMKVLSCAPRVFEIMDFLSQVEVDHIMKIAGGENLAKSATGVGSEETINDDSGTRTSYNSWVERERTQVIDAVFRRAADLMRIDEALLRYRGNGEYPEMPYPNTLAEHLQLVHYDPGQEYTAHHDFGFSAVTEPLQSQRFATLLLYLNEGMVGGSTSFPRWLNAESFEELRVVPEVGKAILFYSQLPDGNMDDLSQHQANIIYEGEKWLINLWVWDPMYV